MNTSHRHRIDEPERLESRWVLSQAATGFLLSLDLAPNLGRSSEIQTSSSSRPTTTITPVSLQSSLSPTASTSTGSSSVGTRTTTTGFSTVGGFSGSTPSNLASGQLATGSNVPTTVSTTLPGLISTPSSSGAAVTVPGAPTSSDPGLGFNTNISGLSPYVLSYPALGGYATSGVAYSTVGGFSPVGLTAGASSNTFSGVNLGGTGSINGVSYYNGADYLNSTIGSDVSSGVGINSAFLGNTLLSSVLNPASSALSSSGVNLNSGLSSTGFPSVANTANNFGSSPFATVSDAFNSSNSSLSGLLSTMNSSTSGSSTSNPVTAGIVSPGLSAEYNNFGSLSNTDLNNFGGSGSSTGSSTTSSIGVPSITTTGGGLLGTSGGLVTTAPYVGSSSTNGTLF